MKKIKIKVHKSDEPTLIAEKLLDAEADHVTFSVPKFSRFGESLSNFRLIKRESEVLNKEVLIESVDEDVLLYAKEAGLPATNPFLEERRKRFSDIVPGKHEQKEAVHEEEPEEEYEIDMSEPEEYDDELFEDEEEKAAPHRIIVGEPRRPRRSGVRFGGKKITITVALIAVLLLGYLAFAVLPKADVTIVTRKEPWTHSATISVDKDVSEINIPEGVIPGQVFIKEDTVTMKQKASGERFIERKARGMVTIYNAYSSDAQQLVVNTRFLTPDGKLFRLTEGVTVPGAAIEDGEISASSIEAEVIADEAGSEYNIGSVPRLSIPGFKGTPRYTGFYGELKAGTSGGFIGEASVPTEQDIAKAKKESREALESQLKTQLKGQLPEGFVLLSDASAFELTTQAIDANTDETGNFTIQAKGSLAALTFKEEHVRDIISAARAEEKGDGYAVYSDEIVYEEFVVRNPSAGEMTMPVTYEAEIHRAIDASALENQILGQSEEKLKTTILGIPGIANAKVSLWPFWVKKIPGSPEKVTVILE